MSALEGPRPPQTSRATWDLSPRDRSQPAGRVLALVLDDYLQTFREHEPGVRLDVDPEELHDFRVALRRSRSLLTAGRNVFPPEELALLEALAAWMAAVTGPVRDLDVLSEDLPTLIERLADELQDGVGPLTEHLAARRDASFSTLIDVLDGNRYQVLLRRWQRMASVYRLGGDDAGPDAARPAGPIVDDLILASYERVRRRAKRAMKSDDRDAWHDLRKGLKRFRYLVGSFAPLYPEGAFDEVSTRLSRLQDTLGRLQDHHVQASLIESAGVELGGRAALTAGALADALHRDAEKAHRRCRKVWTQFDTHEVRNQLHIVLHARLSAGADRGPVPVGRCRWLVSGLSYG